MDCTPPSLPPHGESPPHKYGGRGVGGCTPRATGYSTLDMTIVSTTHTHISPQLTGMPAKESNIFRN